MTEELIEWSNSGKEIKPQVELLAKEDEKIRKIVPTIKKCLARNYKEIKGGCKIGELKIKLKSDRVILQKTV